MLAPVRTAAPSILPVTLTEAKQHLRIEDDLTLEDNLVTGLISAATEYLDGWTGILGRCLVEQEWRQDFDAFSPCLFLPLGPVIAIVSVVNGAVTIDPAHYSLRVDAGGRSYVAIKTSISGTISVTYKAGYPNTTDAQPKSSVPSPIKTAIFLLVGAWYENREEAANGVSVSALPSSVSVNALLAPYRRIGV